MIMTRLILILVLLIGVKPAFAADFKFEGYGDIRAISASNSRSWMDGGLGKTRFSDSGIHFGELVGEARAQFLPELMGFISIRAEEHQRAGLDVLEAYIRYRPVSTTPWRWSVKLGAFFPPISLENTEIGWNSPWTLTPSAINTWVGEELRTIGGEGRLEWRGQTNTINLIASIFGWNDPAGIMLADRGWAMHDRYTGLFDHLRLPDVIAAQRRRPIPMRTLTIKEIDNAPGWYLGMTWDVAGLGSLSLMRYDNEADPAAFHTQYAWETDFWSAGLKTDIYGLTVLAQGMTGRTEVLPSAAFRSVTDFKSAYLLAGWDFGEWRVAARADVFSTKEHRATPGLEMGEHGHAETLAVTWLPLDWLRLTAEALHIESTRSQRSLAGLEPYAVENQFQLSTRVYF